MHDADAVTAVVLAGGEGRRMGGADKGLIPYRGRPLIEWVLAALVPQADRVLISANRNLERYATYGYPVLADSVAGVAGPLAGVLTALHRADHGWLLVTPCDTPYLPADMAGRLQSAAEASGVPLAVVSDGDRLHHSCFIVRAACRVGLEAFLATGGRAVHQWQASIPSVAVEFDPAGFFNLNHPADLAP